MKKVLMVAASGLLLCSTSAMAQTTTSTTNSNAPSAATSSASATGNHQTAESVRAQIRSDMEKAGFTDVKVMPDSFLVEAKDKSGDPVSMIVNPNSATEVVHLAVATPAPSTPVPSTPAGSFTAANVAYAAPLMTPMDQAELAQLTPPVRQQVEAQMQDGQSVRGILETRLLNQVSDRYPGQMIVAADFERGDIVTRGKDGQLHVIPFQPHTLAPQQ